MKATHQLTIYPCKGCKKKIPGPIYAQYLRHWRDYGQVDDEMFCSESCATIYFQKQREKHVCLERKSEQGDC